MIILNKKRLTLIITSIFIAIFVFIFSTDDLQKQNNYIDTVSLPVTEKVIVIDAGHGIPDEGDCLLKFVVERLQISINR